VNKATNSKSKLYIYKGYNQKKYIKYLKIHAIGEKQLETGVVAQVAEHLLSKCKVLSSNPILPKKKKELEICYFLLMRA
jgi:hypothetical protein